MLPSETLQAAADLLDACRSQEIMLATAESCTGGLIAAALTHIPGSADVLDRGFVTYCNEAKTEMLGVDPALIERHGAVSEPVARAMAEGALSHSHAAIAVSVTGIAGPGGGGEHKPVGLVWFGCARTGQGTITHHEIFPGDRAAIRAQTVAEALRLIQTRLTTPAP